MITNQRVLLNVSLILVWNFVRIPRSFTFLAETVENYGKIENLVGGEKSQVEGYGQSPGTTPVLFTSFGKCS